MICYGFLSCTMKPFLKQTLEDAAHAAVRAAAESVLKAVLSKARENIRFKDSPPGGAAPPP